jgi:hypothetical protein
LQGLATPWSPFSPSGLGNSSIAGSGGMQSAIRLNAVARALEFAMAGLKAVADHQTACST